MTISDIHTHHPAPQPEAVIAVAPSEFNPIPGQLYSVGIHPWDTLEETPDEVWNQLEAAARNPQVVAIGECGIDLAKGGPLFRQMLLLKRQALLAEEVKKPLIIHSVKAQEMIIGMKKDLNLSVGWTIHGFRGKPTVAQMYLKAGFWISLGELFNPDALAVIPSDRLLAETDEAKCSIQEVMKKISAAAGRELDSELEGNASRFLNLSSI